MVFLAYPDEAGREVTFVHVFPDAQAMDLHVQRVDERTRAVYQFLEPKVFELYGAPSEEVIEMMRRESASRGVPLILQPDHLGGFIRLR